MNACVDFRLILAKILYDVQIIGKWMRRLRHAALGVHAQGFAFQAEGTAQKADVFCIEYL